MLDQAVNLPASTPLEPTVDIVYVIPSQAIHRFRLPRPSTYLTECLDVCAVVVYIRIHAAASE
jgi:hypothetical protein